MGREHGSSDSMTHAQTHWLQNKHGSLLQNPLDLIPLSGMLETQALRSGRGALAFSPSQLPGRIPVEPLGLPNPHLCRRHLGACLSKSPMSL